MQLIYSVVLVSGEQHSDTEQRSIGFSGSLVVESACSAGDIGGKGWRWGDEVKIGIIRDMGNYSSSPDSQVMKIFYSGLLKISP